MENGLFFGVDVLLILLKMMMAKDGKIVIIAFNIHIVCYFMSSLSHQEQSNPSQDPAKKGLGKYIKIGLAVVLLGTVGLAITGFFLAKETLLKPYQMKSQPETISIKQGDSYYRFIDRIAEEQGVKYPIFLRLYQKFWVKQALKAGIYEVKPNMNMMQVVAMVSNPEHVQMNRILVIEGTTFKQLIETLKKDPLVQKTILDLPTDELLKELNIPETHPEGLFAPDTYFFNRNETDKRILTDLYQRQKQILAKEWEKRDPDLPYKTPYEALIMASIIDKETNVDAELKQVSGVFYRRLNMGMKLQTDPTVIYGMGEKYKGNITREDLRTPTPYNTYTITGLPPTPIALPSQKAIEAALHPDKQSKAIYFVATGKGGHKFSETLDQHNQAVQEYLTVIRSKKAE